MFARLARRPVLLAIAVVAVMVLVAAIAAAVILSNKSDATEAPSSSSPEGVYQSAAVATNGYACAEIGKDILLRNGSAVEAAIAALFCEGVLCLQSMGIGGGFLMTVYQRSTRRAYTLDARETAPAAATETMFHGNSDLSQFGGKAVAVPGELRGYWEAYKKFGSGNVAWAELVEPTIKLCEEGMVVPAYLAKVLKGKEELIKNSFSIAEILVDPQTGEVVKEGDRIKRPQLAKTLRRIATEGVDAFYSGSLTKDFIKDIKDFDGIITEEDLKNYTVNWLEPVVATLQDDITLFTMPLPGSGIILSFIMNILDKFVPNKKEVLTYQRITEGFKYGYGRRTELGDPNFVNVTDLVKNLTSRAYADMIRGHIEDTRTWEDPAHYGAVWMPPEDHGTAHISVLAPNGDAVSVTSTINLILGAMVRSRSTGIILNNEMDDFSAPNITNAFGIPPSPHNYIKPGKRPLSSMVPSVFVDRNGDVRLVVGAAGGTKITTATALVAMHNLWFNKTIKQAIDARRIHHQLFPMELQCEDGFSDEVINRLQKIGHATSTFEGGSAATGIAKTGGLIYANADSRRGGSIAGF